MKVGPFLMTLLFHQLTKSDARKRGAWPDPAKYRSRLDLMADGDDMGFDVWYAPEEKRKGWTLIDIHGGAYVYSSRKGNFGFASVFLEKGYDVVLLDYRPNTKDGKRNCLMQVQNLARQLKYVFAHGEELGLNTEKVVLTGDSAGGHFSLLLAEALGNPELAKALGIDLEDVRIHALATSCPNYDLVRSVNNTSMNGRAKKWMFGRDYKDETKARLISPREHLKDLAIPLFLSTCTNDFIGQESLDLKAEAEALGKDLTYYNVDNPDKAVQHVHNVIDFPLPDSIAVNDAMDAFFAAHLG